MKFYFGVVIWFLVLTPLSMAQVIDYDTGKTLSINYVSPLSMPELSKGNQTATARQQFGLNTGWVMWKSNFYASSTSMVQSKLNPYRLSFHWKQGLNYQPQSFYLLFKLRDLYEIE